VAQAVYRTKGCGRFAPESATAMTSCPSIDAWVVSAPADPAANRGRVRQVPLADVAGAAEPDIRLRRARAVARCATNATQIHKKVAYARCRSPARHPHTRCREFCGRPAQPFDGSDAPRLPQSRALAATAESRCAVDAGQGTVRA